MMQKIKKNPAPSARLFLSATTVAIFSSLLLGSCASSVPAPQATEAPPVQNGTPSGNRADLTQSIENGLSGLSQESSTTTERLHQNAADYLALKKGKASASLRAGHLKQCQKAGAASSEDDALFCELFLKASGSQKKSRKNPTHASRKLSQKGARSLVRALETSRLDQLAKTSNAELLQALKKGANLSKIRPLISMTLAAKTCPSSALLLSLGSKTEESFPAPEFKALAQSLYQRASECGTDESAIKATNRLGLIQIWDHKYTEAEATFAKLTENPEAADFRSRALYWRLYCAKQLGNVELQEKMKLALTKEYPLSLHGLVTSGPSAMSAVLPSVTFRSTRQPQLNASVRLAETLQTWLKDPKLASAARAASAEALAPILDRLKDAEPEFQLYVGLLLTRAENTLYYFKLLTGLFRDYPALISHESLEMLFPLQRFEMVRLHEEKADPYLVISLIRQESAFNENARSRVGATGLMQLMPQTARRMERVSRRQLADPAINIRLGVRFFSYLTERYQGETEFALAAYNAGPDKVDDWKARYPVDNRLLFVDLIPFKETREYVATIARNYFWYKKLYSETGDKSRTPAAVKTGPVTVDLPLFKLFQSSKTSAREVTSHVEKTTGPILHQRG